MRKIPPVPSLSESPLPSPTSLFPDSKINHISIPSFASFGLRGSDMHLFPRLDLTAGRAGSDVDVGLSRDRGLRSCALRLGSRGSRGEMRFEVVEMVPWAVLGGARGWGGGGLSRGFWAWIWRILR